jgi:undecaprenyl-diphosphatase
MTPLIIFGAKYLFVLVALAGVGVVFRKKEQRLRLGLVALIALPIAYALARLVGVVFTHPQPFAVEGFEPLVPHEIDNSFPSDHVALAGVFASVAFLADRRTGLALWALTLLVGLSRMLAGLHWGVDIVMAAALAVLVVAVTHRLVEKYLSA